MDNVTPIDLPETKEQKAKKALREFAIQTAIGVAISAGVHLVLRHFDQKSETEDETNDN